MSKLRRYNATQAFHVDDEDAGVDKCIGRIHNTRIDVTGKSKDRFKRRQPLTVVNEETGQRAVVFAMGAPWVPRDGIAFDYDVRQNLGLRYMQRECDLLVRPASRLEIMDHYRTHPDWGRRVSLEMGLIGLFLGILAMANRIGQTLFLLT